jgi:hypothetical protein
LILVLIAVLILILILILVLILVLVLVLRVGIGVGVGVGVAVVDADDAAAPATADAAAETATKAEPAASEPTGAADHHGQATTAATDEAFAARHGDGHRLARNRHHRGRAFGRRGRHDPANEPGRAGLRNLSADDALEERALGDLLAVADALGAFGDVDRASADHRTAARTCAQFRQGHPHRHRVTFSPLPHVATDPGPSHPKAAKRSKCPTKA